MPKPSSKISISGKHNRTLLFLLKNGEHLEITIGYTGDSSAEKAVDLDNEVIPFITTACNNFNNKLDELVSLA